MQGDTIQQLFEQAIGHHQAGKLAEAQALYSQVLARQPGHPDALHMLGIIHFQSGRTDAGIEMVRRAIATRASAFYHCTLGQMLAEIGSADDAIAAYRRALELNSSLLDAAWRLGDLLHEGGRPEEAIRAYQQALALRPNHAASINGLGAALYAIGRQDEAIGAFRAALAVAPDFYRAWNNLGNALEDKDLPDEAIAAFRRAIELQPDFYMPHSNLGNSLKYVGRLDEAIASYERALALNPSHAVTHSNLVLALHYHPLYDGESILAEHCRWDRQHAKPLKAEIRPCDNIPDPERRLRVGYLGPCFRDHVSAFFVVPLLAHHDHQQVEVFCYSTSPKTDVLTERMRGYADAWRPISSMTDSQAAQLIRRDRIDILVDLTMHTAGGRPLVLARKPAPVQATWLANPATTGIAAVDYRLTDPYLDPPGLHDRFYSETSVKLPETFWCYDPLAEGPDVNELPALASGQVTFGCLNQFCKINDGVLGLWAEVLREVATSRLAILAPPGSAREHVLAVMRQQGVEPARIRFVDRQPRLRYLELYHQLDICLDTFPYNGHTTSLDSFWMGVPVVTLIGATAVGRGTFSQLSNLQLPELAANTPKQFTEIATALAGDLPRLAKLRRELRERMRRSPLMDAPRFTRHMENAYRQMWRQWCQSRP